MNNKIDLKNQQTGRALKEVEDNFINSTKAHITFHNDLMRMAQKRGDMQQYMHHRVMVETYEIMLTNYEASRCYGTV